MVSDLFTSKILEYPECILVKLLTHNLCLNQFSMTKCTPNQHSKLANT